MDNTDLFGKAKQDLYEDMQSRGIGAILWDNSTAGFDYIPEINLADDDAEMPDTSRITLDLQRQTETEIEMVNLQ